MTSAEEVKSKLTEGNGNCKVYPPVNVCCSV